MYGRKLQALLYSIASFRALHNTDSLDAVALVIFLSHAHACTASGRVIAVSIDTEVFRLLVRDPVQILVHAHR